MVELWRFMHASNRDRFHLVVSCELLKQLCLVAEFRESLLESPREIHTYTGGVSGLRRCIRQIVGQFSNAIFHVAMVAPVSLGLFGLEAVVYTIPIASLTLLNTWGRMSVRAGAAFAGEIDVLDPNVAMQLRADFPWKALRIHTTPGSQIDLDSYQMVPFERKENVLSFVGLLSKQKQADRLLACIEEIYPRLVARGFCDVRFVFLGRDTEELRFYARVRALNGIVPVTANFESNPSVVLARSKVFFSVQAITNYPSKSLLEAVACGALPIVTDVGDSRRIASSSFAEFVPGEFTSDELFESIVRVLSLDAAGFHTRQNAGRQFISSRFSMAAARDYFDDLYMRAARSQFGSVAPASVGHHED